MFNSFALLFLISVITFPRSFVEIKFFLLALFLLANFGGDSLKGKITIYPSLIFFYFLLSLAGCTWSVIGMLNYGYVEGITDSFRLYVTWSMLFIIIFTFLRSNGNIKIIHNAIVVSGLIVAVVNLVGIFDQANAIGLIPETVRKELELFIGFREGYIQITSHNIGSLFIIIPYLLTLQLRSDSGELNGLLSKITLLLCLSIAILSGRRALWISLAVLPAILALLFYVTDSFLVLKKKVKFFFVLYFVGILAGSAILFLSTFNMTNIGFVKHIDSAFSSEDERTIQKGFLIDSFTKKPLMGSGFGAYGGYTRSLDRPWIYELTYHQMLFNFGLLGVVYLLSLFITFLYGVIRTLRRNKAGSVIPFSLVASLITLLIGAYSNPYLGSFDFLIYIGLLPYLTTFKDGFGSAKSKPAGPSIELKTC